MEVDQHPRGRYFNSDVDGIVYQHDSCFANTLGISDAVFMTCNVFMWNPRHPVKDPLEGLHRVTDESVDCLRFAKLEGALTALGA